MHKTRKEMLKFECAKQTTDESAGRHTDKRAEGRKWRKPRQARAEGKSKSSVNPFFVITTKGRPCLKNY